jgi:hypothetical protein
MASTYLAKTNPTAGSRQKGTISFWVKRGKLGSSEFLYVEELNSTDNGVVLFSSGNTFNFINYNGGSATAQLSTNRLFRDTSAWYHLMVAWDTTQATSSDRIKMYINGEQETSFSTAIYPSLNDNLKFGIGSPSGNNYDINIGRRAAGDYFTGSMSHFHRVDDQQLDVSVFGEYDANGVWKIKTSPSITYTGSSSFNFFILKDGNSVTDQSGNGNNLTVAGGTLTNTEDNPSNVFATYNPLMNKSSGVPTMSNGNLTLTTNSEEFGSVSSIGVSQGKWYCEIKWDSGLYAMVGITGDPIILSTNSTAYAGITADSWGYHYSGNVYNNNSTLATYSTFATSDILGIALDLDNNKLYFSKNGTWQNSADPSAGTNGISITSASSVSEGNYFMWVGNGSSAGNATLSANFGNGYFGTTAVASAGTNASGNGIFEYDVPTGYTALSTTGLNL